MATLESIQNELESQRSLIEQFNKANEEKLNAKANNQSIVDIQTKLDAIHAEMEENAAKLDALQQKQAENNTASAIADTKKEFKNFADFVKKGIVNEVKTSTDGAGGYAVPEEIDRQIEKLASNASAFTSLCTIKNVGKGYSKLVDVKGIAVAHGTELEIIEQTATSALVKVSPVWGKIEAKPYISQEALEDMFFDPSQWVIEGVNEKTEDQLEPDCISGAGSSGATKGMLAYTMSTDADGVRAFGSFQYIASGVSGAFPSTNPGDGIDKLIDLQGELKAAHDRNASWLVAPATRTAMRKMKDSNGDYYWQPATVLGAPEIFLGKPLFVSASMPAVGTANAYAVAYGDFKRAFQLCFTGKTFLLRDIYTKAPNVQFVINKRYGLMVNNSEAIKFLKLSA